MLSRNGNDDHIGLASQREQCLGIFRWQVAEILLLPLFRGDVETKQIGVDGGNKLHQRGEIIGNGFLMKFGKGA
mgnify:CR=1 FL=1